MTKQEWLSATDPIPVLDFARGRVSHREQTFFHVFCCRRPLLKSCVCRNSFWH
jgi:hypothetical protein